MQFIATKISIDQDFEKELYTVTFHTKENPIQLYQKLKNINKIDVKVKRYRKKRSLNANNYAWQLITEIANVMKISKEEVYIEMLKAYGQSQMVSVLAHIDVSKYFRYYSEAGESFLKGKKFKHYKVYIGSSEMDTKQMSILIDGIVQEAKQLEIETMTPEELSRLKEEWTC